MTEPITIEQYHEAYYQIRQYEFQQMPPGRSLIRLLYVVDVPPSLRHGIEGLLSYCISKKIIPFPSVRDVSDVYFTAYFAPEDLDTAYSWWGRSLGTKSVDTLARAFKKSNCIFGQTIATPLPMPGLIREYQRRDQESALPALPTDMQRFYLSQQPLEPDKLEIRATPSIISQGQYEEAINRYHEYHAQGKGEGRPILALLRDVDAPMRLYNGVQGILQHYIREKLIPYSYSGDVTDVFFAAYFTGEDLLGLRNFGVKALLEFKKIMAQNGCPFK